MGNVQTSSIANQLLPFESYISEVPKLKFVERYFISYLIIP